MELLQYPKMNGLFHGQSHLEMDDDWGYPHVRTPPFGMEAMENDLSTTAFLWVMFHGKTVDQRLIPLWNHGAASQRPSPNHRLFS